MEIEHWLDYLQNEKNLLIGSDNSLSIRLIAALTLLASSIVSIFKPYPYFQLGIAGIIVSVLFLVLIFHFYSKIVVDVGKIDEIQLKILCGRLTTSDEIMKEYFKSLGITDKDFFNKT